VYIRQRIKENAKHVQHWVPTCPSQRKVAVGVSRMKTSSELSEDVTSGTCTALTSSGQVPRTCSKIRPLHKQKEIQESYTQVQVQKKQFSMYSQTHKNGKHI
jgi:hypothetical protein